MGVLLLVTIAAAFDSNGVPSQRRSKAAASHRNGVPSLPRSKAAAFDLSAFDRSAFDRSAFDRAAFDRSAPDRAAMIYPHPEEPIEKYREEHAHAKRSRADVLLCIFCPSSGRTRVLLESPPRLYKLLRLRRIPIPQSYSTTMSKYFAMYR